ncbi:MAG: sigma 54-interacting transcriptional regulator [Deltaproteobacteria bacterium]|jgi:transcriptional regulator with PAS, ATPase and Fis domain
MASLYARVDRLARWPKPVLIRGETGVGKELVAHALHERGPRQAAPFEAVNCGALPPNLVEATLFGHTRGSFSGAVEDHPGLIVAAGVGTLFLDEVGDLPMPAQAALLRVLSEGMVRAVGATYEVAVRARVVAATNRDLDAMCRAGTFREDLYFRLAGITLEVPPLRERVAEIRALVEQTIEVTNATVPTCVRGVSPGALHLLERYRWPGNVRELKGVVERAMVFCDTPQLEPRNLPPAIVDGSKQHRTGEAVTGDDLKSRVRRFEAEVIVGKLNEGLTQAEAARQLGVPLRTLVDKMKRLGIRARPDFQV